MADNIISEINLIGDDDRGKLENRIPDGKKLRKIGSPKDASTRIICAQSVILATEQHAKENPKREIGGILIGDAYEYKSRIYIEITAYIRAKSGGGDQSSLTHFTFTPEIWAEMNQIKDHKFDDLRIVGWYHSHPDHGIFLSPGMDVEIHSGHFNELWQTAMVYDPIRNEGGFFIWVNGTIPQAHGFYELCDVDLNQSVVSWRNLAGATTSESAPDDSADIAEESRLNRLSELIPSSSQAILMVTLIILFYVIGCGLGVSISAFFIHSQQILDAKIRVLETKNQDFDNRLERIEAELKTLNAINTPAPEPTLIPTEEPTQAPAVEPTQQLTEEPVSPSTADPSILLEKFCTEGQLRLNCLQ
jgi:proteasome lid subunit RPN8/RPN11